MLRVLGSPKRLCDGLTRREWLIAAPALGLTASVDDRRADAAPLAGKAKNVILLYLFGGPSQVDTFDPKPDAPAEVRGEFKSIRTRVPGLDICELLPNTARVMDRVTVLRT